MKPRLFALLLFLSFVSSLSQGQPSNAALTKGAELPLCQLALSEAQRLLSDGPPIGRPTFAPQLEWRQVSYTFLNDRGERHQIEAQAIEFDIDNDGRPETLLRESTLLRSETGDFLFVFKDRKAPSSLQDVVTLRERTSWTGIYSYTPWPYMELGLSLVDISPFSFEGHNYVLLVDAHFGRLVGRSMLIVEYRGVAKAITGSEYPTDDFKTICRVVQTSLL